MFLGLLIILATVLVIAALILVVSSPTGGFRSGGPYRDPGEPCD
jgi:hypothetical protein